MKLYMAPGACSLAPHIALREAGFAFEMEKVDLAAKRTESGEDYNDVNPKGYVPALKLANGEVLTEVAVILQYVADLKPEANPAPKSGTMERYRLMEWLNFVASEIHKTLGAFFNPAMTPEWKEAQTKLLHKRLDFLSKQLRGHKYLMGEDFTVADAYLFTVLNWTNVHKLDIANWPEVTAYLQRIGKRKAVQEAMVAEKMKKQAA